MPVRPTRLTRTTQFELMVRDALAAGRLRYSRRLALLKAAQAMGIGRFEANLILAVEQHRVQPVSMDEPRRSWFPIVTWLSAGLIQTLIIAAAWWVVRA